MAIIFSQLPRSLRLLRNLNKSFCINSRISQGPANLKNTVKKSSLFANNKQMSYINNILHLDCLQLQVIALLNLAFWCLVAAAMASSMAKLIGINSDYSIQPSDRACHPFCSNDQDQGDFSRHLNGGSIL